MGRHKEWRPDTDELKRLCQTHTVRWLADYYEVCPKTMQKWLKEFQIQPVHGKTKQRKIIDLPYAMKLADAGYTFDQIAGIFGVSKCLIQRRLTEAGWKKPTHEVEDPQGVNCMDDPKICESCHYGSGGCCLYILFGHGRRPCPAYDCTVYKKRAPGQRYDVFTGTARWFDEEI